MKQQVKKDIAEFVGTALKNDDHILCLTPAGAMGDLDEINKVTMVTELLMTDRPLLFCILAYLESLGYIKINDENTPGNYLKAIDEVRNEN